MTYACGVCGEKYKTQYALQKHKNQSGHKRKRQGGLKKVGRPKKK